MNKKRKKQIALIVLDGWGYREEKSHNAIAQAHKPFFDSLWEKYPHALLQASEEFVGLPHGQMGDSETGHHVMGAGRIPESDLVRINNAISSGEFAKNPAFEKLFDHVKKTDGAILHVEGMLGPGGIHSHTDHLYAFLKVAKSAGVKKVAIHVFTDGHDTPPASAAGYIRELQKFLDDLGLGFIATITGRYFAMDRDNNWDRVKKAEDALFDCKGNVCHLITPDLLVEQLYTENIDDNAIEPIVCVDEKGKGCGIKENDGIFFFNFRPDRARMLSKKIADRAMKSNIYFVTMTEYDQDLRTEVVFPPQPLSLTLGEVISRAGLKQVHIAESEKFAHATYFLNGGRKEPFINEEDILVTSIKNVKGYDEVPAMRSVEIADKALEQIQKGADFIFINFANTDMVSHSGNEKATIKAAEAVDLALSRIVPPLLESGGVALITADHGNAEENIDPATGGKHTSHTTNPVPVILTMEGVKIQGGGLVDVAPTILSFLNIDVPREMTGKKLFL